jgi:hypothetical protein
MIRLTWRATRRPTMLNIPALDWAPLDHAADEPVKVGDMVSSDAGGMPIYRVLAFEEGRAWVATRQGAPTLVMPLDGFRWRARDA